MRYEGWFQAKEGDRSFGILRTMRFLTFFLIFYRVEGCRQPFLFQCFPYLGNEESATKQFLLVVCIG